MKNKITMFLGSLLLAVPLAGAQEDRGEQVVTTPPTQTSTAVAAVGVSDGKKLTKEVIVEEETEKWWAFNAYAGWDSLYMFRGINVLGNGNGIYWFGADVGITPWENGTLSGGVWYALGSYYNTALHQEKYAELDIFLDYTHEFGPLALSFGYLYYFYPNSPDAYENVWTSQNEIYLKAAYEFALGDATITPSATYYYELGPNWGELHGISNSGSSYLVLRLDSSIPVYKEIVAFEPYTAFGINFGFNNQWTDGNTGQNRFTGGNNWELGVAIPVAFTSWLSVTPYVAYSYQWQDLPTYNAYSPFTAENTWWAGVRADFSF